MKDRIFQTQKDLFSKNAESVSKIYHELLLLMKFSQTKPQVENMIKLYCNYIYIILFIIYYTVIKTRDEKMVVNNENDYIILMILFLIIISELNLVRQYWSREKWDLR